MTIDRRRKNTNWNTTDEDGAPWHRHNGTHLAVLMDLRDELQQLNRLLNCTNFIAFPSTLQEIAANTRRKPYTRKAKA